MHYYGKYSKLEKKIGNPIQKHLTLTLSIIFLISVSTFIITLLQHSKHYVAAPITTANASPYDINFTISDIGDIVQHLKRPIILMPSRERPRLSVVCYYVLNNTDLNPDEINFSLCTHLLIGFAYINEYNSLTIPNEAVVPFMRLISLLKNRKNLKALLSVTGNTESYFSPMVSSHANRKIFIRSAMSFMKAYNLDGVDLDWEWPVIAGGQKEKVKFIQLLHELRTEFARHTKKFILSVAVGAVETIIDTSYYVQHMSESVDFVNVMTYDYHFFTAFFPLTDFNTPLYSSQKDNGGALEHLNINYTIHYWINAGMPKEKIMLGLATYGHTYSLQNGFNVGRHAPAAGFGFGENGFASCLEICNFLKSPVTVRDWNNDSLVPFAHDYRNWVSYDDENSLILKIQYAKQLDLGGVMVYSLNFDDYEGYCNHGKKFPLINFIKDNS